MVKLAGVARRRQNIARKGETAAKTGCKNSIAGGDYISSDGHEWYEWKSYCESVLWPGQAKDSLAVRQSGGSARGVNSKSRGKSLENSMAKLG